MTDTGGKGERENNTTQQKTVENLKIMVREDVCVSPKKGER